MRVLLISNSTLYGSGYLDHCAPAIEQFLRPAVSRVLFVPYALFDRDAYAARARSASPEWASSWNRFTRPQAARRRPSSGPRRSSSAAAIRSVCSTRSGANELIEPIRRRVRAGLPYIGSSAGSNVACVTIKTTNDMPIVQPPTFDALNLVPFNINPHYLDPVPGSTHMGETREERIAQFHEENLPPVVGLREGAWLLVDDGGVTLEGRTGARLFRRGQAPGGVRPGTAVAVVSAVRT